MGIRQWWIIHSNLLKLITLNLLTILANNKEQRGNPTPSGDDCHYWNRKEQRSMWPIVFAALSWEIFRIVSWVSVTSQVNKTSEVGLVFVCLCVCLCSLFTFACCHYCIYEGIVCSHHGLTQTQEHSHSRKGQFLIWNVQIQTLTNVTVKCFMVSNFCLSPYVAHLDLMIP